ncbi:putative ErfK/YbiS/YcfS/YnhG family protein [Magnetofaba australis IT-1]|uniref:Putative ErfK/YbiS/YcfS/YnhG family protein n=1 Tax=Magnetofaba australis IT-1 TaxID=1434232 RepID=A0A1Y2K893_9PROT|nr:putative ErfK/YbiS/YcfS/YnhG family protein [Magnetofaba australis IT-1]
MIQGRRPSAAPQRVSAQSLAAQGRGEIIGAGSYLYRVQGHETLLMLARTYNLGYNEITLANPGLDPWVPSKKSVVHLPLLFVAPQAIVADKRPGIVINLPEMRLFHRRKDKRLQTYPVGIGREGYDTPITQGKVRRKQSDPSWYPPASILAEDRGLPKRVPPGPDNPLGSHAIYLTISGYLIHGTNKPFGIGRRVSHGCIRMYPEDIPRLYERAQIGERVRIVDEPVKAGWSGSGELYLEAHPPLVDGAGSDESKGGLLNLANQAISKALDRRKDQEVAINWRLVELMAQRPDGVPRKVGDPIAQAAAAK